MCRARKPKFIVESEARNFRAALNRERIVGIVNIASISVTRNECVTGSRRYFQNLVRTAYLRIKYDLDDSILLLLLFFEDSQFVV